MTLDAEVPKADPQCRCRSDAHQDQWRRLKQDGAQVLSIEQRVDDEFVEEIARRNAGDHQHNAGQQQADKDGRAENERLLPGGELLTNFEVETPDAKTRPRRRLGVTRPLRLPYYPVSI